jgi:hypothetical protein
MRTPVKARLIAALIAAIAMTASAQSAHAQGAGTARGPGGIRDTSPQQRDQDLSVMLFIPWWYGVGVGAMLRYEIPIVPDGFIPAINDQFSLEPSLGLSYTRDYGYYRIGRDEFRAKSFNIAPALYANWSFHITPKFRPYIAIGLGYNIGVEVGDVNWSPNYFYFDIAPGMFFRFSDAAAFRAELGAQGPKLGFSFFF